MSRYEDILEQARKYREDFQKDFEDFKKRSHRYYDENTNEEDILCDFYMWICRRDG